MRNLPITSQKSLQANRCIDRYGNESRFLSTFNPDKQYIYCKDIERCFTGTAPTLRIVAEAYKDKVAESWIAIQIKDLSEFAGCKDKLTTLQIDQIAKVILLNFSYLKVTEMMYFFVLFKSGRFGKFYGAVDGLVITEALQDFCQLRREKLWEYEQKRLRTEREREEKRKSENGITYQEWCEIKWLFNMGYEPERIRAELAEQRKQENE